jgi:hypothetical protein
LTSVLDQGFPGKLVPRYRASGQRFSIPRGLGPDDLYLGTSVPHIPDPGKRSIDHKPRREKLVGLVVFTLLFEAEGFVFLARPGLDRGY